MAIKTLLFGQVFNRTFRFTILFKLFKSPSTSIGVECSVFYHYMADEVAGLRTPDMDPDYKESIVNP